MTNRIEEKFGKPPAEVASVMILGFPIQELTREELISALILAIMRGAEASQQHLEDLRNLRGL